MRLFTTIAIEINSLCNRLCAFCPNSLNTRPDEIMNFDLFKHILEQIPDYSGRIVLYIYNEPTLDPRLLELIKLCRSMDPKSCIMLATNGDHIKSSEDFRNMYEAGLNQLQINVYSENRYDTLKDFIDGVWYAEEGNIYSNCSSKKTLYSLEKKWEIIGNKLGRFELSNRSGNISMLPEMPKPIKSTCVRPFRSMQVNWKGEVILCCNDYHGDSVMGDANTESLESIWNGARFMEYRRNLQNKDRNMTLCDVCSFKGGSYKHVLEKV